MAVAAPDLPASAQSVEKDRKKMGKKGKGKKPGKIGDESGRAGGAGEPEKITVECAFADCWIIVVDRADFDKFELTPTGKDAKFMKTVIDAAEGKAQPTDPRFKNLRKAQKGPLSLELKPDKYKVIVGKLKAQDNNGAVIELDTSTAKTLKVEEKALNVKWPEL
jgi:hypothetical protein